MATGGGTYSESYLYDPYTRLSSDTLSLPADASYTYGFTYDASSRLQTLQYPVSTSSYQLKLLYGYANGQLQKISDFNAPSTIFWTANSTNPAGQITQETLGNGVVTNRSYDAVTGWIGSAQAGVGGGNGLLNSAYLFDLMGNVSQRQNNILGLTENFYYDNDYRLQTSKLNGNQNLAVTYDPNGNILTRSDVASGATWTYDPARKHAVTQAGSNSFSYDANGNAKTRNGFAVSWTSYNYPTDISSSGEEVQFWYGPGRQRWKTYYVGTGIETTYHVGGLLEKVANSTTTDYRHYIYAGNEPVAIYSRTTAGTNTLRYVLEDHEGSYSNLLTSTGTSYVNESFSAFGSRRNASTWSGVPTSGDESAINSVSREGYTGETVLGVSMGLNHLNGRVEDSTIGRFLSPDPEVPEPANTQSFNRYSYARNNPLTLVDPTGFDEQPPIDPITVTCCTGSPDGGGDLGDGGGGLSPYESSVLQAGLWGVTNLPNGANLDMAHAHDGQRGFWLDYNFETYTTTDPEGNEVPAASGADAIDNFSLTVTAPRSNWIPFSDCEFRVDCTGAVGMLGQNAFFRGGQPVINKVGMFVTIVASFGYGSGTGAAAWGSRAFGFGTLFEGLASRGVAADAKFAQATFGRMFSAEGTFAGRSVQDVAAALRSGAMRASDVPVNYIVRDGQTIILNTRSAQALEAAGIPRAQWNGINQTGNSFFENLLNGQLGRNPGGPFDTVRPSGGP